MQNRIACKDTSKLRLPARPTIYHYTKKRSKGIIAGHFFLEPVVGVEELLRHLGIHHGHRPAAIDQQDLVEHGSEWDGMRRGRSQGHSGLRRRESRDLLLLLVLLMVVLLVMLLVMLLLLQLLLLVRHLTEYHGALVPERLREAIDTGAPFAKFLQQQDRRLDSAPHGLLVRAPGRRSGFTQGARVLLEAPQDGDPREVELTQGQPDPFHLAHRVTVPVGPDDLDAGVATADDAGCVRHGVAGTGAVHEEQGGIVQIIIIRGGVQQSRWIDRGRDTPLIHLAAELAQSRDNFMGGRKREVAVH